MASMLLSAQTRIIYELPSFQDEYTDVYYQLYLYVKDLANAKIIMYLPAHIIPYIFKLSYIHNKIRK